MKRLAEYTSKVLIIIITISLFTTCESDTLINLPVEHNAVHENIESFQSQFKPEPINSELHLGIDNFTVYWSTASEVYFNKYDSIQK